MKTTIPHYCPEWDFLWITPQDIEWEVCHCRLGEECLNLEDALGDLEEQLEIDLEKFMKGFHQP